MTTTTIEPIETLHKSLRDLTTARENHKPIVANLMAQVNEARSVLEHAQRDYEEASAVMEAIDLGMAKHREAIARLKSLEKGARIVENYSPQVMDDDLDLKEANRYIGDDEL